MKGFAGVYVLRAYSDAAFTPATSGRRKRASAGMAVAEAEIWVSQCELAQNLRNLNGFELCWSIAGKDKGEGLSQLSSFLNVDLLRFSMQFTVPTVIGTLKNALILAIPCFVKRTLCFDQIIFLKL